MACKMGMKLKQGSPPDKLIDDDTVYKGSAISGSGSSTSVMKLLVFFKIKIKMWNVHALDMSYDFLLLYS